MPNVTSDNIGAFKNQPTNQNFLTEVKFKFQIHKTPNVNYFCTEVVLPGIRLGAPVQPTPFQDLPVPGIKLSFDELQITFNVDEDMGNYIEILDWMYGLGFPKNYNQYANLKNENTQVNAMFGGLWSDAVLHILTNESNANLRVMFRDAFPVSLSAVTFKTDSTEAANVRATASFQYSYFDIIKNPNTLLDPP